MTPSVFRPLRVATFAFLSLIAVGLVISAWLTLREQQRLREARTRLERSHQFQRTHVSIKRRLITVARAEGVDREGTRWVIERMAHLVVLAGHPETPARIESIRLRLARGLDGGRIEMVELLVQLGEVAVNENLVQAELLAELEMQSTAQLRLELAAPLAILAAALLLLPYARRRVLSPLDAFGRALSRVAEGHREPIALDGIDPLVLPLHGELDELVRRLRRLEAEHEARAATLESEVRAATRTLLEQQRSLARAERLAATGELAASVAHELRNPLAGIRMTLANLRSELRDAELVERVDLVIAEVDRLTRLLNDLLDTARHAPEPPRAVDLATMVDELLGLVRYQLPAALRLESSIETGLSCRLPADRLRQALLNLVLNAAAALPSAGGTITVEARREGERLLVSVADDGPGFSAEVLAGGGRPFASTRAQGTGLGLTIVRRFARDLGGELRLANRAPHGARATLDLPAEAG